MHKLYISLLLLAMGLLWFFIPHITTGVLNVVVCAFFIVAALVLRIVIKKHLKTEEQQESVKSPHRRAIFMLTAALLLVALIGFRKSPTALSIFSAASALWMVLLFASGQVCRDYKWENVTLPMLICILPVFLAFIWTRSYHMGLYPVLQFYSTVLAFGISYWLILSINLEKQKSEIMLISLLACGFVLTYSLNFLCSSDQRDLHAFTAVDTGSYGTSCEMDDGWMFTYPNCPTKLTHHGAVYQHEGWFNIVYLEPAN